MPPYQGARARFDAEPPRRVFAVSKWRLDEHGDIEEVLWAALNPKSDLGVSAALRAPVSEGPRRR